MDAFPRALKFNIVPVSVLAFASSRSFSLRDVIGLTFFPLELVTGTSAPEVADAASFCFDMTGANKTLKPVRADKRPALDEYVLEMAIASIPLPDIDDAHPRTTAVEELEAESCDNPDEPAVDDGGKAELRAQV